jgi:hypothetical protein
MPSLFFSYQYYIALLQIFCSPKRPARKGASSMLDLPHPARHWALIIMLRIMLPTHGDGA